MQIPNRIRLANLPTPLVPLERLGQALGGARLWLKRDDLTGLEISGNKIRKLEYIAAAALAAGCDTLVTEGTPQSNHCRATAATCARLGLHCVLLLRPAPTMAPQGNHLLDVLFGAECRGFTREEFRARSDAIVTGVLGELRAAGRKPRWTPAGASEPLGCWGYIRAAAELADQLHKVGVHECDVVVALSSGGTYAGLLLGMLQHRLDHWRLWAVPVSDDTAYHQREVRRLCEEAIAQYGLRVKLPTEPLPLLDGHIGPGYAVPTPAALAALRELARTEAILLDPVYTAKAFGALRAGIHSGRFGFDRPAVFIHTGGLLSNFAWPEVLLESTPV
ncbi:MAG: D-cysteine desulfhydrase family protein [Phycisphaerales bacterium]|nr:D-cysteine desulfhydrase family protein [Phycisphaerales bacterium]